MLQIPDRKRLLPVDLTRAAVRGLYPGDTPAIDTSALPRGRQVLGGVQFVIPGDEETLGPLPAVDWHTRATPPIPVGKCADALAFLHSTTVIRVHAPTYYSLDMGRNLIGAYAVTYDDEKVIEIPLEYGWNIDSLGSAYMQGKSGDQSATIGAFDYAADPVLSATTDDGRTCTVFMFEWVNPRPGVAIRDVRLLWRAGYTTGTVALLGLTAVQTT